MAGEELAETQQVALDAIVQGKRAWSSVALLVKRGHEEETLRGLIESGWLVNWELPSGPHLTLTPWAAEQLNLELRERWEYVSTKGITSTQPTKGRPKGDIPGELSKVTHHLVLRKPKRDRPRRVQNAIEIPRWVRMPPPQEKGMPKARPIPVKLPQRIGEVQLPNWLEADWVVEEAEPAEEEAREEDKFLMQETFDEAGQFQMTRVVVLGLDVPRATGKKKCGKKKRRRKSA